MAVSLLSRPASCPICGRSATVVGQSAFKFTCTQCGEYKMVDVNATEEPATWSDELKMALSCATRQAFEAGERLELSVANAKGFASLHLNTRVADNEQRLLLLLAEMARRPGQSARLSPQDDFTRIDCFTHSEFAWHVQSLEQQGLVTRSSDGSGTLILKLSLDGWRHAQPSQRPGGIPGRCFVAMWFDDSMTEAFEMGISPGVMDCGFPKPIRIDQKEHNNQITDEIMAGIRDAEFVIADFSGHRGGVYYEAGFARGLGRPVIYCCQDRDFDERHFDTKAISHIKWSTPVDLRTKLVNRIKATILDKS